MQLVEQSQNATRKGRVTAINCGNTKVEPKMPIFKG